MDNKKLLENLNVQYNFEIESAYIYKAMAIWLDKENWGGFANFFYKQEIEEIQHAEKLKTYLIEVGYDLKLKAVAEPQNDFNSIEEIFEIAYNHEKEVTSRINKLFRESREVEDYATEILLTWFVTEQIEEEDTFSGYIERLERINGNISGLTILNNEMYARQ